MGKAVNDKDSQVTYLKQRLNLFVDVLDSIDPEQADVEDIDRLIAMIDDIEVKCEQFKKSE
ncbi:SE1561 family protein [Rossellomorea aquimaris]|uniref:SE1561 family protein n=1 Tax=Rossellomorea aquimaris TaxID=189382 RepID=UPI0007D0721D|nr:SE1561 family protein [Rossellomorea aquimaris]